MVDFKELINSIRNENITLFIGSGFSIKAGAPSTYDLVTAIKDSLDIDESIDSTDLDKVSEEYEQMHSRESLIEIIRKKMSFKPTDISDHEKLTLIPHIHNIITTNYDTLLEDTYGHEKAFVIRNAQDCSMISKDKVNIIKIHGDFKSEDTILLTKQDYADYFVRTKEPLLWNFVKTEMLTKDILFIGYSLEDTNVFEMIKQIKNEIKNQTRNFFLIAPCLKPYKVERLAKTKIKYYDAKAEDLFPPLFCSLNKHIYQDYKRKRISLTTLSQYSRQHGLEVSGKEGEKTNTVEFTPTGTTNININLKADKNIVQKLITNDPFIYKDRLNGSLVPGIKIPVNSLKSIDLLVNGMSVGRKEDLSFLFLSPSYEKVKASLKIKQIGFNEKIEFVRFNSGNSIVFKSKVQPFTFQFVYTLKNKTVSCTFNITFEKTYQNNSEALKWIELPIALCSNNELIISIFPQLPLRFPSKTDDVIFFNQIKRYYQNIKNIELWYDIEFDNYNNYSDEQFELSELLVDAYQERFIPILNDAEEPSFEIDDDSIQFKDEKELQDKECSLSMSYQQKDTLKFNGHIFTLKHKYIFVTNCKFLSVIQLRNNKKKVCVQFKKNTLYKIYTENDISKIIEMWNLAVQAK